MSEPLRLAQFLRERCARNQYGLRYLNQEQTLLFIPWPVVPRPNEEPPPGFQMFHEWAEQSHRRRGNSEAPELRESATQQKHRFRNALARANGIVYRKDISYEGARVYELVDSRRQHDTTGATSPYNNDDDIGDDLSDYNNDGSQNFNLSPSESYPVYPQPVQQNGLQVNEFGQTYYPYNQQENLVGPPVVSPAHSASSQQAASSSMNGITQYNNILTNGHDGIEEFMGLDIFTNGSPQQEEQSQRLATDATMAAPGPSNVDKFSYAHPVPKPPENTPAELELHVRFRQDDAMVKKVANKFGCRVYFGKNIPDLSQLLEKEHLENIMSKFRFDKEWYYGPESLQQVQLPRPEPFMKTPMQSDKTSAILTNMDRGLLLFLEHVNASKQMNIPDVYAMRLCQTRIFPCYRQAGQPSVEEGSTLKRMEWKKVFDGKVFYDSFLKANEEMSCGMEKYPSPSFSFSLGQKPPGEERSLLLVCLTVTVQRAQQLIQNRLDSEREEICISYLNSTDVEARNLAKHLTDTLTLD